MNYYHMWFDLIDTRKDIEFSKAVDAYLGHLKSQGRIEGWKLTRRKFGFGPEAIGEFHCSVWTKDLAQLDQAFSLVATRAGEVERLHHPVYSAMTKQYLERFGRWRDALREACLARGIAYFLTPSSTAVDQLVLGALRKGGMLR
jgi:hypothetical protein